MAKKKRSKLLSSAFSSVRGLFPRSCEFIGNYKRWLILPIIIMTAKVFTPSTFFILSFACIFYLIFYPVVTWLQSIFQSNKISVAVFVVTLTAVIIVSAAFLIPALVNQIIEFSRNYPAIQNAVMQKVDLFQNNFQDFQKSFLQATNISAEDIISKYLNQWGQAMISFFDGIVQSLSDILTRVFHVLVAFIVSLYLLFERRTILKFFKDYFVKEASEKENKFVTLAYQQIVGYFSGLMFLSLIGFIATWIFLSMIDLKFSLLLAIWTGIMEFIPIFGPVIAIIPIAIVAWTQAPNLVLYIIAFFLVLQFILGYLLAPQVLGKKSQFSPIFVFVILLIGAETYGILGMIFSIPIVALLILFWKVSTNRI